MAGHLSSDEFFTNLTTLLATAQQKGHGSIYLTQKRLTYDTPSTDDATTTTFPIIIRATDGNSQSKDRKKQTKVKISTVVKAEELEGFFARYAEVCKAGMGSLKKRDRSKRKKGKKREKGVGEGGK